MTTLGLDYAGGRPSPQAIKTAGYDFVVRYLSDGGPGLPGKLLTPDEAAGLLAAGVNIVSNWETTADRMLGGYNAGVDDANAALAQVLACGGSKDRPIYFSCDFDEAQSQQPAINAYLQGAGSVLGTQNVGIYGGYWPVSRALDAGVARRAWQTDAWSGSNVETRAQIHQRAQQVWVDGVSCDLNEALADDYGQWSITNSGGGTEMDQAYFDGYMKNVVSDLKDCREQLTGGRDRIDNANLPGGVDVAASYPGWPQLGGRTVVDAIAAVETDLGALKAVLVALATMHGVDLAAVAPSLAASATAATSAAPAAGATGAAQ